MRIPAILQGEARTRFLQGIAFGVVAAMAIGFIWGGWVTEGTARAMSNGGEQRSDVYLSPDVRRAVHGD
jgi:hypothetical protein